jgi:hypothetical protein
MKTIIANHRYRVSHCAAWIRLLLLAVMLLACLTACNKDKDAVAPAAPFAGRYDAQKQDESRYTMTLENKDGARFQIQNFADFLYVPLEATAAGDKLTIPTQSFASSSGKKLTISGTATLVNDELRIEYTASGFANYEDSIVAKRKP